MHAYQPRACRTYRVSVAPQVVPDLLGPDCSLHRLHLSSVELYGTFTARFGNAAVCSTALRSLQLSTCGLRGPLPELRLPALERLSLEFNHFKGGLEPLRNCTALKELQLHNNQLKGGLEPLQGCTALQELRLSHNLLTGGLEPLRGCTALRLLNLGSNRLSGEITPLRSCSALQELRLGGASNHALVASDDDRAHFETQCGTMFTMLFSEW